MKLLTAALTLLIPVNAFALTPSQLKELILKRSLRLKVQKEQVKAQEFKEKATFRSYFPKVSLSASFSEFYPDLFNNWNQNHAYGVSITAEPLNLQRNVELSIDREKVKELRYAVDSTFLDVYSEALSYLYRLKVLEREVELRRKQLESSEKILSVAKEKFKKGLVMITDVLKAKSEVEKRRALLSQAENDYRKTFNSLNALLDFSLKNGEKPEVNLIKERLPLNPRELVRRALLLRPEVKEAKQQVEIAKRSVQLVKRNLSPRLSVNLSAQRTGTDFPGDKNYSAGFTLSFPVFDSGLTKFQTLQQVSQLKQAQLNLKETENSVKLQVLNALSDVKYSYSQLNSSESSLKYARKAYERALNEYRLGVSDIVALLQAFDFYCQSQTDYLQSLLNYNLSIVSLKKATGELLGGEN